MGGAPSTRWTLVLLGTMLCFRAGTSGVRRRYGYVISVRRASGRRCIRRKGQFYGNKKPSCRRMFATKPQIGKPRTALDDRKGGRPENPLTHGRPFYDFAGSAPPDWRETRVRLGKPAVPLPSWLPEVWTQQARNPLDNTRSAMVRDLYGNRSELADWNGKLRTHIASFQKEVATGTTNVFSLPPLTSMR